MLMICVTAFATWASDLTKGPDGSECWWSHASCRWCGARLAKALKDHRHTHREIRAVARRPARSSMDANPILTGLDPVKVGVRVGGAVSIDGHARGMSAYHMVSWRCAPDWAACVPHKAGRGHTAYHSSGRMIRTSVVLLAAAAPWAQYAPEGQDLELGRRERTGAASSRPLPTARARRPSRYR